MHGRSAPDPNPVVIFASYGDNITPPHQALGWIPAVYRDTEDLKAAGQRIVYLTNPHVGHLGIFVSAKVARLEHRAILESLGDVSMLPPGLYEMRIDNPTGGDPDCKPNYAVRFEEREVADLRFDYPRAGFERVRALSEFNARLYSNTAGPWVKALATPWSATALEWLHPMRTSQYLLSESFVPGQRLVSAAARIVERERHPASPDNTFRSAEKEFAETISRSLTQARRIRDAGYEQLFRFLYEGPWAATWSGWLESFGSSAPGPASNVEGDAPAASLPGPSPCRPASIPITCPPPTRTPMTILSAPPSWHLVPASGVRGRSRHHRLSADRGLLPAFETLGTRPRRAALQIILACPLMHLFMHGGHGRNASGPTGPQHRHDGA